MFKTRNAGCVLRFKCKRKIANAKIYEDKRDLYCTVDALSEAMDDRVVASVTTTQPEPDQLETLLRRLLSGPVVPSPPPEPVPSVLEQVLQSLLTEAQAPQPTPPAQTMESASRNFGRGRGGDGRETAPDPGYHPDQ